MIARPEGKTTSWFDEAVVWSRKQLDLGLNPKKLVALNIISSRCKTDNVKVFFYTAAICMGLECKLVKCSLPKYDQLQAGLLAN